MAIAIPFVQGHQQSLWYMVPPSGDHTSTINQCFFGSFRSDVENYPFASRSLKMDVNSTLIKLIPKSLWFFANIQPHSSESWFCTYNHMCVYIIYIIYSIYLLIMQLQPRYFQLEYKPLWCKYTHTDKPSPPPPTTEN